MEPPQHGPLNSAFCHGLLEPLLTGLGMLLAASLLHLATMLALAAEAYLRQKTAALDRGAAND